MCIRDRYKVYADRLRPMVRDTTVMTYDAIKSGKEVLFEGAQGTLLDLDMGTYPYVTSSHPVAGGCCIGSGVGPTAINEIMGIFKSYTCLLYTSNPGRHRKARFAFPRRVLRIFSSYSISPFTAAK